MRADRRSRAPLRPRLSTAPFPRKHQSTATRRPVWPPRPSVVVVDPVAVAGQRVEDFVGCLGPDEWLGVVVPDQAACHSSCGSTGRVRTRSTSSWRCGASTSFPPVAGSAPTPPVPRSTASHARSCGWRAIPRRMVSRLPSASTRRRGKAAIPRSPAELFESGRGADGRGGGAPGRRGQTVTAPSIASSAPVM